MLLLLVPGLNMGAGAAPPPAFVPRNRLVARPKDPGRHARPKDPGRHGRRKGQ